MLETLAGWSRWLRGGGLPCGFATLPASSLASWQPIFNTAIRGLLKKGDSEHVTRQLPTGLVVTENSPAWLPLTLPPRPLQLSPAPPTSDPSLYCSLKMPSLFGGLLALRGSICCQNVLSLQIGAAASFTPLNLSSKGTCFGRPSGTAESKIVPHGTPSLTLLVDLLTLIYFYLRWCWGLTL